MWGTARIDECVSSYADAEQIYNNTKPVRGTNTRPVGCQRSRYAKLRIEKAGDDYVLLFYNTCIVTYRKDGSVFLQHGGWRTPSTAAAMSAMSPFIVWNSKGETTVANHKSGYASTQRFVVPLQGLEFRKDEQGVYQPVDPPVAVLRKRRVKREEAREARKFFKQVPVFIKTFSAAFEGGQKPQVGWPNFATYDMSQPLAEEDAVNIAWYFVRESWGYATHTELILNAPRQGVANFWGEVYNQLHLREDYEVPLSYGEVA